MGKDICIMIDDTCFNFRVACVTTNGDKMLLHRNFNDDFWNLVGGRVKCGEITLDALIRELEEETNYKFDRDRFKIIQICENFFIYNETKCHELDFIYHLELNNDDELVKKQDFHSCDNPELTYHWFDKSEITPDKVKCLPEVIYKLAMRKKLNTIELDTEKSI